MGEVNATDTPPSRIAEGSTWAQDLEKEFKNKEDMETDPMLSIHTRARPADQNTADMSGIEGLYGEITQVKFLDDSLDVVEETFIKHCLKPLAVLPGFQGWVMMKNAAKRTGMMLTLYDSVQDFLDGKIRFQPCYKEHIVDDPLVNDQNSAPVMTLVPRQATVAYFSKADRLL